MDEAKTTTVAVRGAAPMSVDEIAALVNNDPYMYDESAEEKKYARSLLQPKELRRLKKEIKKDGFMPIDQVKELIAQNSLRESSRFNGVVLDPEMLILIDTRTNYKTFVTADGVYTRDDLLARFPFARLQVTPESIFAQQEIGIFPAKKYAMDGDQLEYIARDVGDESVEFTMLEDVVGAAARKNYKSKRAPISVVLTKVFIGREAWDDFAKLHSLEQSMRRLASLQVTGHGANPLLLLANGHGGAPSQPRLLTDESEGARAAELKRREDEAKLREEEAKQREIEAKRREEELRERERLLEKNLERIEMLYSTIAEAKKAKPSPAESKQPPTESKQPPTESKQPPAESEQPPAESKQPPTPAEQQPAKLLVEARSRPESDESAYEINIAEFLVDPPRGAVGSTSKVTPAKQKSEPRYGDRKPAHGDRKPARGAQIPTDGVKI